MLPVVSAHWTRELGRLPAIRLSELAERGALLSRVDRKYVMDVSEAESLVTMVPRGTQVLDIDKRRSFGYCSTYLDTESLACFTDAAHGRTRRFTVRVRRYEDSGEEYLEVKTANADQTIKERIPYRWTHTGRLTVEGERFVVERLAAAGIDPAGPLRPVLQTRYQRTTLFMPETSSRVTVDLLPSWTALTHGPALSSPRLAIVETKTDSQASSLDRLLWSRGHQPVSISKYATGLAALNPNLPRHRWNLVLAQWFAPPTP